MGFWSMLFGNGSNNNISNSYGDTDKSSTSPANPNGANWLKNIAPKTVEQSVLTVYDVNGSSFEIYAVDLKASGGEGAVYEFRHNHDIIIKIYK